MAVTNPALVGNTINLGYTNAIDSLYAFNLVPQKYKELIDLYGDGFGIREWLYLAGQEVNVKSHEVDLIERGTLEDYITLGGAIAVNAAGDTLSITLAAGDYDANGNCFLAVDDAIYIPPTYISGTPDKPAKYQITSRAGAAGAYTFTATPFDSTYQIAVQVPVGAQLMVTGGNYARGSDGPGSKSRGWYERHFETAIKKRGFAVEGGATATERYTDTLINGEPGLFTLASIEADRFLDSDMNDELFLGETNENDANLVMPNRDGTNNVVYGTLGLWNHLVAGGCAQTYVGTYEVADLADVRDSFLSQGVIDKTAVFGVGSELFRYLEDSGLDFLQSFSASDLMKTYGEIGVTFRAFTRNQITFIVQEMLNLSNPVKYGIDTAVHNWKKAGFIIPQSKATVKVGGKDGTDLTIDNLTIGYVVNNGENRKRIVKLIKGVEGHTGTGDAVDTYDDIRGQMLTEFMLMVVKRNQMIYVVPSTF